MRVAIVIGFVAIAAGLLLWRATPRTRAPSPPDSPVATAPVPTPAAVAAPTARVAAPAAAKLTEAHRAAARPPTTTPLHRLPTKLADVALSPAVKKGLSILETEYYQTPNMYSGFDYRLALQARLDSCASASLPSHGYVQLAVKLVPANDEVMYARGFDIVDTDLAAADAAAADTCLKEATAGLAYQIREATRVGRTTLKMKVLFPLERNAIYEFLRTGDPRLIVGKLPPLSAPAQEPWSPGPTAQ